MTFRCDHSGGNGPASTTWHDTEADAEAARDEALRRGAAYVVVWESVEEEAS